MITSKFPNSKPIPKYYAEYYQVFYLACHDRAYHVVEGHLSIRRFHRRLIQKNCFCKESSNRSSSTDLSEGNDKHLPLNTIKKIAESSCQKVKKKHDW